MSDSQTHQQQLLDDAVDGASDRCLIIAILAMQIETSATLLQLAHFPETFASEATSEQGRSYFKKVVQAGVAESITAMKSLGI